MIGVGYPVVVTSNEPGTPTWKCVDEADVIAGTVPSMRTNVWCTSAPIPFDAVMYRKFVPVCAGTPEMVAVPLPLSWNVTPAGMAGMMLIAGPGNPVVVIVNEFECPTMNAAP